MRCSAGARRGVDHKSAQGRPAHVGLRAQDNVLQRSGNAGTEQGGRNYDQGHAPLPQALIPLPLHPGRLAARGYNQSVEIARVVGPVLGLPVDVACCRRVLATPPQAGLDERTRRRNIRGAFAALTLFHWRQVAILDDVLATGSTVNELTWVLRRVGVRLVEVWAVVRTSHGDP